MSFLKTGEVDIHDFISEEHIRAVTKFYDAHPGVTLLSPCFEALGQYPHFGGCEGSWMDIGGVYVIEVNLFKFLTFNSFNNNRIYGYFVSISISFYICIVKGKNHIENEYAAGCAKVSGGCVAYHGALQYYALQTQQFKTIYLHSDKRFRPFVIDGVAYEYHPLKFTYNVVVSKDSDGNPIAVTSLSQTMVDCIRHIDLAGGLEELLYALSSISYGQLKEKDMLVCLEAYDNASLWSRTGYLLSLFKDSIGIGDKFLSTCRIKGSGVKNKLSDGEKDLEFVPGWNMFVPKDIGNMIAKGTEYGTDIIY